MAEPTAMLIQQMIPPATMIPASALLLLSSTARMNTVLARIRTFHGERLAAWREDVAEGSRSQQVRMLRLEGLEHQTDRLIVRACLLRTTMLLLFASIACNLLTMIAIAGRLAAEQLGGGSQRAWPEWLEVVGAGVFVLGILCMLAAMATSILEVRRIVETVQYEHARVATLLAREPVGEPSLGPAPARSTKHVDQDDHGEGMGL